MIKVALTLTIVALFIALASCISPTKSAEIISHELIETERGLVGVEGVVQNTGTTNLEMVWLTTNFYDTDGVLLGGVSGVIKDLAPKEKRNFKLSYVPLRSRLEMTEIVASYDIELEIQ